MLLPVVVLVGTAIVVPSRAATDCIPMGSLLTYYINGDNGPCWPGYLPFTVISEITSDTLLSGFTEDRYFSGDEVATYIETGGAYMPGGTRIGDLGPEKLFLVETIQIDVTMKAASNPDYEVTVKDIEEWICENGPIPPRAFVIINTGWSFKRGNRYYGKELVLDLGELDNVLEETLDTDILDELPYLIPGLLEFSWPGLSAKAAEFLYECFYVVGIGIDTPAVDAGYHYRPMVGEFPDSRGVRRFLTTYGIYLVHNVLLLDIALPARGIFTTLGVFNICKGVRAPVNVYVEYCADPEPALRCVASDYLNVILGYFPHRRP